MLFITESSRRVICCSNFEESVMAPMRASLAKEVARSDNVERMQSWCWEDSKRLNELKDACP